MNIRAESQPIGPTDAFQHVHHTKNSDARLHRNSLQECVCEFLEVVRIRSDPCINVVISNGVSCCTKPWIWTSVVIGRQREWRRTKVLLFGVSGDEVPALRHLLDQNGDRFGMSFDFVQVYGVVNQRKNIV